MFPLLCLPRLLLSESDFQFFLHDVWHDRKWKKNAPGKKENEPDPTSATGTAGKGQKSPHNSGIDEDDFDLDEWTFLTTIATPVTMSKGVLNNCIKMLSLRLWKMLKDSPGYRSYSRVLVKTHRERFWLIILFSANLNSPLVAKEERLTGMEKLHWVKAEVGNRHSI